MVDPSARSSSLRQELGAPMNALLDDVAERPAFLPLVPLAVVDPTVRAERLVAVDRDGMMPGTWIDQATGMVRVPAAAVAITSITKNGAPFTNTGQFSVASGDLQIHPVHMPPPAAGIDQYVVVLQNEAGRVTTATVDVAKGSVHILRVSLTEEDEPAAPADTTPDAFGFTPAADSAPGSLVGSDPITVTGIDGPAPIAIVGGEYSIDGGPFTSAPGVVLPGQQVRVRVQAPAAAGASATVTLTIGGVSAELTVTTAETVPVDAPDMTPDAFAFTAQTRGDRCGRDLEQRER